MAVLALVACIDVIKDAEAASYSAALETPSHLTDRQKALRSILLVYFLPATRQNLQNLLKKERKSKVNVSLALEQTWTETDSVLLLSRADEDDVGHAAWQATEHHLRKWGRSLGRTTLQVGDQ